MFEDEFDSEIDTEFNPEEELNFSGTKRVGFQLFSEDSENGDN